MPLIQSRAAALFLFAWVLSSASSFGVLVLQVEDVRKTWWSAGEKPRWRDAKPIDLAATEFRQLLDLGNGRPLVPLSRAAVAVRPDGPLNRTENGAVTLEQPESSLVH